MNADHISRVLENPYDTAESRNTRKVAPDYSLRYSEGDIWRIGYLQYLIGPVALFDRTPWLCWRVGKINWFLPEQGKYGTLQIGGWMLDCRLLLNLIPGSGGKAQLIHFGGNRGFYWRDLRMNRAGVAITSFVYCQHQGQRIWTNLWFTFLI